MAFNPNMANREVMNVVLLDYKSKVPFLNVDFANVSTTNFTANRVYARGGWGAPNRVGFDGERTGTLQIDTQIMPAKLFALLSGKDIEKSAKILKREELTAAEGGLTLSEDPLEAPHRCLPLAMIAALPLLRCLCLLRRLLPLASPMARITSSTTT